VLALPCPQLEQAIGTSVSGLVHTEADYFEMTPEQRLDAFKKFAQAQHSSKELFDEAQRLDVRSQALALLLPIKFNESMILQLKQKPNLALLQRVCARITSLLCFPRLMLVKDYRMGSCAAQPLANPNSDFC
jgi:hypothetical protein